MTETMMSQQKNQVLRLNIASLFLFTYIAGSVISSSLAFTSQQHARSFNRIPPTLSHDSCNVNSRSNIYMSTAEIENPALRRFDEDENKDDEIVSRKVVPAKVGMHGPVTAIRGSPQFLHMIETAPKDSLVVIKFHAKFCKVCARVILKFKKMANKLSNEDTAVPVIFADVELTENSELCSILGIKKFPYLQIYRNTECIASFGTGPAHNFQRAVGGTIQDRLATTDSEWEKIRSDLAEPIADGKLQLRLLRLDAAEEE